AFAQTPNPQTASRLQQLRLQLAQALGTLPPGTLAASWNLFAATHARLMGSGLRDFIRAPVENQLLEHLKGASTKDAAKPLAAEPLVAAMLLARNFELPVVPDLEQLPDWMRGMYFQMLLESPQVFNEPGEAEHYLDFLEGLTDRVHREWVLAGDANS